MVAGFAFVNDDDVSSGIKHHGHVAHGCFKGFHFERHASGFQCGDGRIKIHGLEPATWPVSTRQPAWGFADGECVRSEFILDPAAVLPHRGDHGGYELEQALVKGARGRKIRDWITGESDFGKEHEGVLGGYLD